MGALRAIRDEITGKALAERKAANRLASKSNTANPYLHNTAHINRFIQASLGSSY